MAPGQLAGGDLLHVPLNHVEVLKLSKALLAPFVVHDDFQSVGAASLPLKCKLVPSR